MTSPGSGGAHDERRDTQEPERGSGSRGLAWGGTGGGEAASAREQRALDRARGRPGFRWAGDGSLRAQQSTVDQVTAPPPGWTDGADADAEAAPAEPTAEGIAGRPFATFPRRAGGFAIDFVIKLILLEIVFIATGLGATEPWAPQVLGTAQTLNLMYDWLFWSQGWTPGARILRMRIVQSDGVSAPGRWLAVIRTFGRVLSEVAFFIGYVWMLRDPHRQTWHDKMAGTYVVMARDEDY